MIFKRLLVASLAASVLVTGNVAFAQEANQNNLQRLTAAAQSQGVVLDQTAKTNIQAQCPKAQDIFNGVKHREQKIAKSRLVVYQDIQNQVLALEIRLKRQGVEIAGVGGTLLQYQKLLTAYNEQTAIYQQTLEDVTTISCQENAEAFVAGATIIRQKRAELLTSTTTIDRFVKQSIFSELDKVKQDLKL